MDYLQLGLTFLAILVAIYYLSTRNQKLLKRHGIVHIPPTPFFGNLGPLVRRQCHMEDVIQRIYDLDPDAKYVGMYEFTTPLIIIRDPELIKTIGVKEITNFTNHRPFVDVRVDPMLGEVLFAMQGDRWREHRTMLTTLFTSSKIKSMFVLMSDCAKRFADYLSKVDREIEMKSVLTRYTNDVIARCVYGISVDSVNEPENIFYKYGQVASQLATFKQNLMIFVHRNSPRLARLLNLKILPDHIEKFFYRLVVDTIEARRKEGVHGSDMLQQLMDMQSRKKEFEGKKGMAVSEIANHAFSFFFGSVDTMATQISLIAHMLAVNPDVQQRLQEEIDEVLSASEEQAGYDVIQEMKYLDAVMSEAMRYHPILLFVDRVCGETFELPPALPGARPFKLERGMNIWFPVKAIHHDPKYFENPEKFDPDRFLRDGKSIASSGAYMPFGMGPRKCIGSRFALTEMKILLFNILAVCSFKVGSKTMVPLKFKEGVFNPVAKNGFWLKIEPRENSSYGDVGSSN